MQLLRSTHDSATSDVVPCEWTLPGDDVVVADYPETAFAVSYSRYLAEPDQWNTRVAAWTLVIEPADELLDVSAELLARPEILISFPVFTDGRGYSHAATLRTHHGYSGGLVAIGDVRRDQLDFMQHSGFTAFEITGNDTVEEMLQSLGELVMPAAHRLYAGAGL